MSRSYSRRMVQVFQSPSKKNIKNEAHSKERAEVRQALRRGVDPRPAYLFPTKGWALDLYITRGREACWWWVSHPEHVGRQFERRTRVHCSMGRSYTSEEWLMPWRWFYSK